MKQLIRIIKLTEKGDNLVSARELHTFLGSQRDFTDWMKYRIEQYGFEEGVDFIRINHKFVVNSGIKRRGRPAMDYGLTMDTAKEMSMVEGNEKGREARKYFIAVEKQLRMIQSYAIPQSYAEALELAAKQQRMLETNIKEIAKLKPKAEYVDRAIKCEELTEMSMACKVLDLPYGRNTLYAILRKSGTFFRNRNEPAQHLVTMGYFKIKQKVIKRKAHPDKIVNVPLITEKGLVRLLGWLKDRGLLDKESVKRYLESN